MSKLALLLILWGLVLIVGVFFLIKNNNTYKQHIKIDHAIYAYHVYCIYNKPIGYKSELDVNYTDEESYDKTFFKLFDWGYKNILPKDKYEIIKDYIE